MRFGLNSFLYTSPFTTESVKLFPKFKKRPSLGVWQTFYCHGRFTTCARYRLSLEGKPVPPSLLPNGKELNLASLGL